MSPGTPLLAIGHPPLYLCNNVGLFKTVVISFIRRYFCSALSPFLANLNFYFIGIGVGRALSASTTGNGARFDGAQGRRGVTF
jgi:hypothetical protein